MSSKVHICNLALSFVGNNPIADLNENSVSAQQCKLFYDIALEQVLRAHPWNFAAARVRLVRVDMPDGLEREYQYAYAYPQQCVRIHNLVEQNGAKSRRFEVFRAKDRRIVATDLEEPVAAYTAKVDDATFYDGQFIQALARRLQCLLVKPLLKNNPALIREAEELYRQEIAAAMTADAQEGRPFQDAEQFWNGGHDTPGADWAHHATRGFHS